MFLHINLLEDLINNKMETCFDKQEDCISLNKGYNIIEHAYELLKHNSNFYCEDIISNLRKAINYRLRDLTKNLGLNKLKFKDLKSEQKIEKLEQLGIVKGLLLTKLLNIRNKIEYEGLNAPNSTECQELIDIVWYFYKTTDIYCKLSFCGIIRKYYINDINYYIYFKFDFANHTIIKFDGLLPNRIIGETTSPTINIPIDKYEEKIPKRQIERCGNKFYSGEIRTENIDDYNDIVQQIIYLWSK